MSRYLRPETLFGQKFETYLNEVPAKETDVFAELTSPDLLVIDNLGKESQTPWAVSMIYMAIGDRYNTRKPVVATSSHSKRELVARLSQDGDRFAAEAIVSRLSEMTAKVEMGGEDRLLLR